MKLACVLLIGCGGGAVVEQPVGPPAGMEATRADPADVIVARVNGKPVWGSCVTGQAKRGATKQDALNQCIAFELLAQRAQAYVLDPDVARATHTAMVSGLVATQYEDAFTKPAQFGPIWDQVYKKGAFRLKHENYRASAYVRINVKEGTEDPKAEATAKQIAAALAKETGLLGPSLVELAQKAAPGIELAHENVTAYRAGALDAPYARALFALPEIGRASDAVRTKFGWDVIVWTDDVPAANPSDADVDAALLNDAKVAYFRKWTDDVGKALGVKVTYVDDNVKKLEDLP
ncbi:MAG: peptidylprolyl isomerase [Kofleriaceae bacterium]